MMLDITCGNTRIKSLEEFRGYICSFGEMIWYEWVSKWYPKNPSQKARESFFRDFKRYACDLKEIVDKSSEHPLSAEERDAVERCMGLAKVIEDGLQRFKEKSWKEIVDSRFEFFSKIASSLDDITHKYTAKQGRISFSEAV